LVTSRQFVIRNFPISVGITAFVFISGECKGKFVPVLNQAPHYEDVLGVEV